MASLPPRSSIHIPRTQCGLTFAVGLRSSLINWKSLHFKWTIYHHPKHKPRFGEKWKGWEVIHLGEEIRLYLIEMSGSIVANIIIIVVIDKWANKPVIIQWRENVIISSAITITRNIIKMYPQTFSHCLEFVATPATHHPPSQHFMRALLSTCTYTPCHFHSLSIYQCLLVEGPEQCN